MQLFIGKIEKMLCSSYLIYTILHDRNSDILESTLWHSARALTYVGIALTYYFSVSFHAICMLFFVTFAFAIYVRIEHVRSCSCMCSVGTQRVAGRVGAEFSV